MSKITYNFVKLKAKLELLTGKQYTWAYIAEHAGVSQNTMSSWVNNRTARADLTGLAKLLDFFAAEGMPITIDQLFTVQEEGSQAENLDSQPL